MMIKFPLKMSDGTSVRTIEELRDHFDFTAVFDYYSTGRLKKWLEDRYYDEEAEKVGDLDSFSEDFKKNLCNILGVDYLEDKADKLDLSNIAKKNECRERLKKYTADDKILASIDSVAFTQEELIKLLERLDLSETDVDDYKVIYLCGDHFTIPAGIGGIVYAGVNNPVVKFDDETIAAGIDLQNVEFEMSDYVEDDRHDMFFNAFKNNLLLGLKLLHQIAEQGNAEAQFLLGLCYMNGKGVEEDRKIATKWLKKAAKQDHVDANVILYTFCIWSTGGELAREVIRWFEKADKQNSRYACLVWDRLGECYLRGIGVERDYDVAVKWLKKAVEQDSVEVLGQTQYYLGYCYYYGYGVEQNHKEAVKWLQKAAEQGDVEAQSLLVLCTNGEDVEQKDIENIRGCQKGTELDDAEEQYRLGECYEFGRGVEENEEEAVKWYRRAAECGHVEAQYRLGECYEFGRGIEINKGEAIKWYRKAAGQKYEEDIEAIKWYEQKGAGKHFKFKDDYSFEGDDKKAVVRYREIARHGYGEAAEVIKWYRKAIEQNDAEAQYSLGECYGFGRGIEINREEAIKWYRKAAEQGHEQARAMLKIYNRG